MSLLVSIKTSVSSFNPEFLLSPFVASPSWLRDPAEKDQHPHSSSPILFSPNCLLEVNPSLCEEVFQCPPISGLDWEEAFPSSFNNFL